MTTIPAASNLSIGSENTRWQLYFGVAYSGELLLEATAESIRYSSRFATARQLPPTGSVSAEDIEAVFVGWAVEDSHWHLGLMFSGEVARTRGGRWCGLARWTDSDGESAERAGRDLANLLAKPITVVQKEPAAAPVAAQAPAASTGYSSGTNLGAYADNTTTSDDVDGALAYPDVPLMTFPIAFAEWNVIETPVGPEWDRTKRWRNEQRLRGLFFALLTPLFGVFSLGAIFSPYAKVQPDWLPIIGLILTLVMLYNAVSNWLAALRSPITLFDRRVKVLRQSQRLNKKIVQSPFEGIDYLLVSHVVTRQQAKPDQPTHEYVALELWVHAHSVRRGFIQIAYSTAIEGHLLKGLNFKAGRRDLQLHEIDTPAHHAAQLTANELDIPVYVEARA